VSPGRNYPKSATVQNWFLVSEIATIYSPRFACFIVKPASKRSCTASKFAQRRTSNKRFKFVRFALWDCVPQPLNLVVSHSFSPWLFWLREHLQNCSNAVAQPFFKVASHDRFYPKSATVQNCFLVNEIATIYSPRFTCGTVQSASKRSCIASKFAQRRTSNKRFKFVRCALWDCVPQPLNLVVSQSYSARLFWLRGNLQNCSNVYASNIVQSRVAWPELSKIGNRSKLYLGREIATIYSPHFTCSTVQSASKRSCIASKVAQRRTSNKRFKSFASLSGTACRRPLT
jgi:hypothetical protein